MARNVQQTQRRLRAAASAEHGVDGTTVTRIANRAGVIKERLYAYFGSRDALFDQELEGALARWFSVPQLATMLAGAEADAPTEPARRRAFVVEAAQRSGRHAARRSSRAV